MKRFGTAFALLSILSACGPADPITAQFKGTWKQTTQNGISGAKEETTMEAVVKGKKFRVVARLPLATNLVVYDGQTLYANEQPASSLESTITTLGEAPTEQAIAPSSQSKAASEDEVASLRFWTHAHKLGGQPGPQIAGRETRYYRSSEKRPDGEFTLEGWVDAKSGVLLKQVQTVYSSQIGSIVTQDTAECEKIDYSPVDDSAFQKP